MPRIQMERSGEMEVFARVEASVRSDQTLHRSLFAAGQHRGPVHTSRAIVKCPVHPALSPSGSRGCGYFAARAH